MKTIIDIKKEQEQKHTELFNKVGLFFAFSNEQFETGRNPDIETKYYISIGSGGILPKDNILLFTDGMKEIKKWYKAEVKANKNLIESTILDELKNFECFYTGEITAAVENLKGIFSFKQIYNVFNKYKMQLMD